RRFEKASNCRRVTLALVYFVGCRGSVLVMPSSGNGATANGSLLSAEHVCDALLGLKSRGGRDRGGRAQRAAGAGADPAAAAGATVGVDPLGRGRPGVVGVCGVDGAGP